ncbi:MAG: protein phosphatase CheZ [Deltaproteobacteria bacterium]|nr:protein phosphatase CheZ [Deltaproteobacteria bacterium]
MKDHLKAKISSIVDDKLSSKEIEELIKFLEHTNANNILLDDEPLFRDLAYEMTGRVKDLALLIIDFRRDLKSKIHPEITDIATKYIPQATNQLADIIEATEKAANKIMDNLDSMQEDIERMEKTLTSLKKGKVIVPKGKNDMVEVRIDGQIIKTISPLIDYIESSRKKYMSLISDSFVQMSFQDLTGQRIKRTMSLVSQMEEKIKTMVISFGIKLTEMEKNPDISKEQLERAVEEKTSELTGPQKEGQGLDQSGIDELLANI